MKTINKIRVNKLNFLIKKFGGVSSFAKKIERNPTQVYQWKNEHIDFKSGKPRAMSSRMARYIEKCCGMPEGWLDMDHETQNEEMHSNVIDIRKNKGTLIPIFNAVASMGQGCSQPDDETILSDIFVNNEFITENLKGITSKSNLAMITGKGNSMSPSFEDGDILIVDTGIKSITVNDVIYVISIDGSLFIKRAKIIPGSKIELTSDNPSIKSSYVYDQSNNIIVHGRVRWSWSGKRL